jgi:hypothetical protein
MFAKERHRGASNGVTSGTSLPHDVTSANATGHVHKNDGEEISAHEIVPLHAPTCPEYISSILRKSAIYPHTATKGSGGIRFEIKEGPKLEEWIPEPYLPEVLVVYDPDGVSSFTPIGERPPMKIYKRTHPAPASTRESKEGDAIQDG